MAHDFWFWVKIVGASYMLDNEFGWFLRALKSHISEQGFKLPTNILNFLSLFLRINFTPFCHSSYVIDSLSLYWLSGYSQKPVTRACNVISQTYITNLYYIDLTQLIQKVTAIIYTENIPNKYKKLYNYITWLKSHVSHEKLTWCVWMTL